MLEKLPHTVTVYEVGPRDGLQNEARHVPTEEKIKLIEKLAESGLKNIEITSFVSPKWIPQLADGLEVAKGLRLPATVSTSALVPNLKGLDAAKRAGIKTIALFMSATESHSKKNINKSISEALSTVSEVAQQARADNLRIRAYLSVVFVCPYEGKVDPVKVSALAKQLFDIGVDEISFGDTIGMATPGDVIKMVKRLEKDIPLSKMAMHFHDTCGTALANVLSALDCGITTFDSSIGGMGGCPYAPGAAGNLATEDLVYMLNGLGIETGVDLDKLVAAGQLAEHIVQRPLPGRYLQAQLGALKKACSTMAEQLQ